MKKDISKRKTPFFCILKGLSNKQKKKFHIHFKAQFGCCPSAVLNYIQESIKFNKINAEVQCLNRFVKLCRALQWQEFKCSSAAPKKIYKLYYM